MLKSIASLETNPKSQIIIIRFTKSNYIELKLNIDSFTTLNNNIQIEITNPDGSKSQGTKSNMIVDSLSISFNVKTVYDNVINHQYKIEGLRPIILAGPNIDNFEFNIQTLMMPLINIADPLKKSPYHIRLEEELMTACVKKSMERIIFYQKPSSDLAVGGAVAGLTGINVFNTKISELELAFGQLINNVSTNIKNLSTNTRNAVPAYATTINTQTTSKFLNLDNLRYMSLEPNKLSNNADNLVIKPTYGNLGIGADVINWIYYNDKFKPQDLTYTNTIVPGTMAWLTSYVSSSASYSIKLLLANPDPKVSYYNLYNVIKASESYQVVRTSYSKQLNLVKNNLINQHSKFYAEDLNTSYVANLGLLHNNSMELEKCLNYIGSNADAINSDNARMLIDVINISARILLYQSFYIKTNNQASIKQIKAIIAEYNAKEQQMILDGSAELKVPGANKVNILTTYNQNIDGLIKSYVDKIYNDYFNMFVDMCLKSAIDYNEPTTSDLGLDYRKLLASYFVQRAYFANLREDEDIKCNEPAVLKSLEMITQTISFLFDNRANIATRSLVQQRYEGNDPKTNILSMNPLDLFSGQSQLQTLFMTYYTEAFKNKNSPVLLTHIPKMFDELNFNPELLFTPLNDQTDYYKFNVLDNGQKKEIHLSDLDLIDLSIKPLIDLNFTNLIKRLVIISYLSDEFKFLNILDNYKTTQILIPLFDDRGLLDQYNKILYRDFDKITYTLEFENKFNIGLMYSLVNKTDSVSLAKSNELSNNKRIWMADPGSEWLDLGNKLIPMYLLNVRQGFWINHTIRHLMRTIMYSTDSDWIGSQLFDNINGTRTNSTSDNGLTNQRTIISRLNPNKQNIASKLITKVKLLYPDLYKNPDPVTEYNLRSRMAQDIFNDVQTMEEFYMAEYDIKSSPWLKLLYTVQHIGSNKYITKNDPATLPVLSKTDVANLFKIESYTNNTNFEQTKNYFIDAIKRNEINSNNKLILSKSLTLLLALSTRADKLEGVEKTLEFANIITQITNQECGADIMVGGSHNQSNQIPKSKYKLRKIY